MFTLLRPNAANSPRVFFCAIIDRIKLSIRVSFGHLASRLDAYFFMQLLLELN